jgi:hypothetical protein
MCSNHRTSQSPFPQHLINTSYVIIILVIVIIFIIYILIITAATTYITAAAAGVALLSQRATAGTAEASTVAESQLINLARRPHQSPQYHTATHSATASVVSSRAATSPPGPPEPPADRSSVAPLQLQPQQPPHPSDPQHAVTKPIQYHTDRHIHQRTAVAKADCHQITAAAKTATVKANHY